MKYYMHTSKQLIVLGLFSIHQFWHFVIKYKWHTICQGMHTDTKVLLLLYKNQGLRQDSEAATTINDAIGT